MHYVVRFFMSIHEEWVGSIMTLQAYKDCVSHMANGI